MLAPSPSERSFRVLGVFAHPRLVGHAVLDSGGLVAPGTFATRPARTGDVTQVLAARVIESVVVFRPDLVVVVIPKRLSGHRCELELAVDGLPVPCRLVADSDVENALHAPDVRGYDRLGQIVAKIFPSLVPRSSWTLRACEGRRRSRPIWKAVAAALVALAELDPSAARRLAGSAVPPGLVSLIDRSPPPV